MGRDRTQLAIAGLATAIFLTCAVLGFIYPRDLVGCAAWSVVTGAVLWGLGAGVGRALKIELSVGEQLVAGTVVWITVTGWLLAIGLASRWPLMIIAALGLIAAIAELVLRTPRTRETTPDRTAWIVFYVLLGLLLALNLLGMVGTRGNPADDQAAYTAFVKRILDCGNLVEPFSFRRLSAYGGQTVLHALVALRGDVAAIDLLDRGIYQIIGVLVLLDIAHRRKLHVSITILITVFLLSAWDLELNSGAIWTGFACFTGAYAFASRDDLAPRAKLLLVFGALGATCTLRQNYLPPAALFAVLLLVGHARDVGWRTAWRTERTTMLLAIAAAAAAVLPYMIATVVSNRTPLYPILLGTGNPATPLRPTGGTLLDEVSFFISIAFAPQPIRVWWLLIPAMALAKDARAMRPWRAFLIASGIGFVFLVHSFMLSDAWNLWRYAFAYLTPLALVFAIEVAAGPPIVERSERPALVVPIAAAFLVWLALVVNLVETRSITVARFQTTLQSIKAGASFGTRKYDPRIDEYEALQNVVPAGATVAVMLDEPWVLDYARNPIVSLDLPGIAAPAPGLPSFTDAEHWRSYFVNHGIRYLAYSDADDSSYLYRRGSWRYRMFSDDELYAFLAAHLIDAVEAFDQLRTSTHVLFDRDGLYVLDLGETAPPEADRGLPELVRMDRFKRHVSEDELHNQAWQLAMRSDVVFEPDGSGPTQLLPAPGSDGRTPWSQGGVLGLLTGPSELPHRWLMDRTRIRVKGRGHDQVHAKLWIKTLRAYTIPTITLTVDGQTLAHGKPDADGFVVFDATSSCDGWCDLYIVFSSTFDWWLGPEDNGIAQLLEFEWSDAR